MDELDDSESQNVVKGNRNIAEQDRRPRGRDFNDLMPSRAQVSKRLVGTLRCIA